MIVSAFIRATSTSSILLQRSMKWGNSGRYVLQMSYTTSSDSKSSTDESIKPKIVDVPLVFVPGMKGTHLAHTSVEDSNNINKQKKKKRAWLTLGNLLNIPPRPDDDQDRDLSLPLTYDYQPPLEGEDGYEYAKHYPRQHRGNLIPDGCVDHIIQVRVGNEDTTRDLNFLPFYGHATQLLREIDKEYHSRLHDGKIESTESFKQQDDNDKYADSKGIIDRVGAFIERTTSTNLSFLNTTTANSTANEQSHKHCRPTAVFTYDWRRSLPELATELHEFCEATFPNQPVQIMAHSLGGLLSFDIMRKHPEKYAPGAVVVGVPFETGIQYLQDLHKGYYTELDRCRQFTPDKQFSMSSHWSFFPITKQRLEDRFVDVTNRCNNGEDIQFNADQSGIGKQTKLQPKVEGDNAYFDFYSVDEWERNDIGIFGPLYDDLLTDEQRQAYKEHMKIQLAAAKEWRKTVLGEREDDDYLTSDDKEKFLPPFVACQSNTVPTLNQILRRRRKKPTENIMTRKGRDISNPYEYDYINGRAVPGDGRIDYDKAFPPDFVSHKRVTLDSPHTKQMCWESSSGSLGRVYEEVVHQAEEYLKRREQEEKQEAISRTLNIGEVMKQESRRSRMKRLAQKARKKMKFDILDTTRRRRFSRFKRRLK